MKSSTANDISAWEGEGGAAAQPAGASMPELRGSEAQVEWAGRIRNQVNADFDRVAASFRGVAARQFRGKRAETEAVLAILEEKRSEVMAMTSAGYFIHDWQETGGQVRKLIFDDPRYQTLKSRRFGSHAPYAGADANSSPAGAGVQRMSTGLRPLQDRIVVKPAAERKTLPGGLILPDSALGNPCEGEVIAAGPGRMLESGQLVALDVKAGDRVLFAEGAGIAVELMGNPYIILRGDDVLGVLDPAPAGSGTAV